MAGCNGSWSCKQQPARRRRPGGPHAHGGGGGGDSGGGGGGQDQAQMDGAAVQEGRSAERGTRLASHSFVHAPPACGDGREGRRGVNSVHMHGFRG